MINIMIKNREDKRYLKKVMVIRDKLILILFVGMILTSIFTSIGSANILGCMESPKIWYVDDDLQDYPSADFAKIQDAVNSASAGDTIIVYSGTYYENVLLNKTITLMGKGMPTVDANDIAIIIDADDCKVEGFRCVNSFCGIKLWHDSSNNTISNNICYNNTCGIYLWHSSNNIISNNTLYENHDDGIFLYYFSDNNIISSNTVYDNHDDGIFLHYSSNNTISNNTIRDGRDDGIGLWDCSNNTISNNMCEHTVCCIFMIYSSNNMISNNTGKNSQNGINLWDCSNNTISNNTYEKCRTGIFLYEFANNNIISKNVCKNNKEGIFLYEFANNNIISKNVCENNDNGIQLYASSNNVIYLNNFVKNDKNACSYISSNVWNSIDKITYIYNNNTYINHSGNFWSDYEGIDNDSDGIGDTSYSINSDKDNYPMMEPFENYLIEENQPPIVSFTYSPENPVVNEMVTFNASSSYDPDGNITKYEWEFGDGNTGEGEIINYSYSSTENYTLILTVTDDKAASQSISKTIIVLSPTVSISTDKFEYYPGDTMTISIDLSNPTEDGVMFYWYWGVPQFDIWDPITAVPIPAHYDTATNLSFSIPNLDSIPFVNIFEVHLLNASGNVLDRDATGWAYTPNGETMPVDIAGQIKKTIERVRI
jgi:parallel beta-helix repeat protein